MGGSKLVMNIGQLLKDGRAPVLNPLWALTLQQLRKVKLDFEIFFFRVFPSLIFIILHV